MAGIEDSNVERLGGHKPRAHQLQVQFAELEEHAEKPKVHCVAFNVPTGPSLSELT